MQLSEKDKQALQEKIKEQRQAMWSGKQSASPDTEEDAAEADHDVGPPIDTAEGVTGPTEVMSSDEQEEQSDSSTTAADPPAAAGATNEETGSSQPTVPPESDSQADAPAESSTGSSSDTQADSQSLDETEISTQEPEAAVIAGDPQAEGAEQETADERVFWETLEQEGGSSILTWKIVLAVIGVAVVLVGVGVYLGFLFAG